MLINRKTQHIEIDLAFKGITALIASGSLNPTKKNAIQGTILNRYDLDFNDVEVVTNMVIEKMLETAN